MIDLKEIFGVDVDVIHGSKKDSWMIEIDKEIEIYAAYRKNCVTKNLFGN